MADAGRREAEIGGRTNLPLGLWVALTFAAAALFGERLWSLLPNSGDAAAGPKDALSQVILFYSTLPRMAVAIVAGAALGLAGLLLQRVLRNPLAEPSTLGISAGAQLAMTIANLFAPELMELSPDLVAFVGGIAAVGLILSLTWRRGLEPVSVVLVGMMVALTATSASGALILANGEYLFSLFIWGGGSLAQQSWAPVLSISVPLTVGFAAAALLLRPLTILGLDDASARNLGLPLNASRFAVIALAVWIATSIAAQVGVIGFVGLAAPALATLSGARSLRQKLVAAPLIGAILLWLTDGLVQIAAGTGGERIPTGAATALLGGPLLLWLLPRLRMFEWPSLTNRPGAASRTGKAKRLLLALAVCTTALAILTLLLGRGPTGWSFASGDAFAKLMDLRLPRVGVAAASGGMLAAAGVVIQRITGNALASPEVLGVGAGAGVGLTAVLLLTAAPGLGLLLTGSALGALAVLAIMLGIAARGNFGPERLLLAGVAMTALCSAIITAVIAMGNAQSYAVLRWLTGSTNQATAAQAIAGLAALLLLTAPLFLASRWLDIFPLGAATSKSLGVPVARGRLALILVTALLSAFAALFVGPLSFVGLIAPHLVRLLGLARARQQLLGSILIGIMLMVLSDWLSRMVAFPYQLPVGLFASLLAGPYLVYLLGKGVPRNG